MRTEESRRSGLGCLLLSMGVFLGILPCYPTQAADVLILGPTVSGGMGSLEATKAVGLGLTVDVVDAATWGAMTTEDFASYRAIVLGDPTCVLGTAPIAAAEANTGIWGLAITGNVVIVGSDPTFHSSHGPAGPRGGDEVAELGIAFAADEPGRTGAYITLSCYYHNTAPLTPVPLLDAFVPGGFTVAGVGCFDDAHIVATHPALTGLADSDLSNWFCSVHEAFDTLPVNFQVLAIARNFGAPYTAPDGTVGTPFIIGRGLAVISDIDLAPETAVNQVGTQHTVTAFVEEDGAPVVGTDVTFSVIAGPHVGTNGVDTTDINGEATFTYTGTTVGIDTLHAQFVDASGATQTSNTVTKEWTPGDEACCFSDNTCVEISPSECLDLDGDPTGSGSFCLGVEACCLPDNTCQEMDARCCLNRGGAAKGPGSICLGIEACQLPDQTCQEIDAHCCLNEGGIPKGPGSLCLGIEACCLPDNTCEDIDAHVCLNKGGRPQGLGSACSDVECAIGACCDGTTGSCANEVPQSQCTGDPNDQFRWEKGVLCDELVPPCEEHSGACCDGTTGVCTDAVLAGDCIGDQQEWFKEAPCSAVECLQHTGACCDGTTGVCTDSLFPGDCLGDQQEWFKDTSCGDLVCEEHTGACCDGLTGDCMDDVPGSQCPTDDPRFTWFKGEQCDELKPPCMPATTISVDKRGSLLIYSKVEIKWDAAGNVTQDTFLDITNDYPQDVFVQVYFVNGDEPLEPVFAGDPPKLVERSHSGWNWVACQILLTGDQPMYWSSLTGGPLGCPMFTFLDPGTPPGRPDLDGVPGSRVLRGFVYAWAVDQFGEEICWNHLKGDAVIVNYADPSAWEYNAWAAQTFEECVLGDAPDDDPGHMCLNGYEYDACYDKLLLDFYASGSTALSGGGAVVQVATDLTLFPVDADLRQDTCGPVLTKATFDVWNQNEIRFSGTTRCITCWDQTLLSKYEAPNHFLIGNLHTDKGKARINGVASDVCDENNCSRCDWPNRPPCSQDAPLLGVAKKMLGFSSQATGRAAAGVTLVGMGAEPTCIVYDILEPPRGTQGQFDHGIAPVEDASQARTKVRK